MRPPYGASSRKLTLHYDVIGPDAPNHETLVMARSDWHGGLLQGQPSEPIGSIHAASTEGLIEIDRSKADWWLGFAFFISLGLQSLAGNGSYLLFLVVLLLPIPLLSARGRWRRPAHTGQIFWRIAKLLGAFTAGYTITFLASTLTGTLLPPAILAALTSMTILAAATHAIRPIFAHHIGIAGATFGLFYGLIFVGSMPAFDLSPPYALPAALAYALGTSLMLLLATLLFAPSLILLSRSRYYRPAQVTVLIFALLLSVSLLSLPDSL
jgi:hypothetical protein